MPSSARLDALLEQLHARWGAPLVQQGMTLTHHPPMPTGFPVLDEVLDGGLPTGQHCELLGVPTCGVTTLAYSALAHAQSESAYVLVIDLSATFDPAYAAGCGLDLARLFLARPDTGTQALDIARDLLQAGCVAAIALDLGRLQPSPQHLHRLTSALARSGSLVVLLMAAPLTASPAAVRLKLERLRWLERSGEVYGCCSRVTVLKHRSAKGRTVEIAIDFGEVRG